MLPSSVFRKVFVGVLDADPEKLALIVALSSATIGAVGEPSTGVSAGAAGSPAIVAG